MNEKIIIIMYYKVNRYKKKCEKKAHIESKSSSLFLFRDFKGS